MRGVTFSCLQRIFREFMPQFGGMSEGSKHFEKFSAKNKNGSPVQNLFPSWTVVFSRLFALWERFDKKYIVDSFEGKKAKKEVYFPRNHPLSGNQRI